MQKIERIGMDWIAEEIGELTDEIIHVSPSEFNEKNRYLPESVSSIPGYIRYDVNPFMREIVDCFDIESPVREVNLKKGVQITYSTVLESGALYFIGHVKTLPMMYMTADKGLAEARVENNFLPMLQQSGMASVIRSSDEGNSRKTGQTKDHLQFEGGGYMVPFGAKNADKMRSYSICVLLKDEIDAWPDKVGKDGDPDALSDDRCSGYWERRKIFRGSTPLITGSSKIDKAFERGDQRKYLVLCKACGFPQELRWSTVDKKTGVIGGFRWETEQNVLLLESVCYCCQNCGHAHYEYDKERLFSPDYGAKWEPTARPAEPFIRSYHLPAFYSPIGMQPWYKCVSAYLKGYDPVEKKVIDMAKYQVFYNNILAKSFQILGSKIFFSSVSGHRRPGYRLGQIPNTYAEKYSGSRILFLFCLVDVHKKNLAVAVIGFTKDAKAYLITYERYEVAEKEADCTELSSPVWSKLQGLIEEQIFIADDGQAYKINLTFIDAGYANDTVSTFCSQYESGVSPTLGRDRPAKNQRISEFAEFTTQIGTTGYRILVDHYKDRLAPVLRREWTEEAGEQKPYHFNAPVDLSDSALKELTAESRRSKTDETGNTTYFWHRPPGRANELWDILNQAHAGLEIMAWSICVKNLELKAVVWQDFWQFAENPENDATFSRVVPSVD